MFSDGNKYVSSYTAEVSFFPVNIYTNIWASKRQIFLNFYNLK